MNCAQRGRRSACKEEEDIYDDDVDDSYQDNQDDLLKQFDQKRKNVIHLSAYFTETKIVPYHI